MLFYGLSAGYYNREDGSREVPPPQPRENTALVIGSDKPDEARPSGPTNASVSTALTTTDEGHDTAQNAGDKPIKRRKNRPGVKFGAKKRLWVWLWFVQDYTDPNVAACDFCGKIIVRLPSDKGLPKKLIEHLRTHKLEPNSVNYSRAIPIDGYGVTYTPLGEPMNYPNDREEEDDIVTDNVIESTPMRNQMSTAVVPATQASPELNENKVAVQTNLNNAYNRPRGNDPRRVTVAESQRKSRRLDHNLLEQRRVIRTDFDNAPYSAMKFHKHVMKFLTENRLPIAVIKSHSFQQMIYDLRTEAVSDLAELTTLYSSLLEVQNYSQADEQPSS